MEMDELCFQLVTTAENYEILMNLIAAASPYPSVKGGKFVSGPQFKARSLALEILHNLGNVEGCGSFVASKHKKEVIHLFKHNFTLAIAYL